MKDNTKDNLCVLDYMNDDMDPNQRSFKSKQKMMYYIILGHRAICNVIMKVSRLVYVILISLDDYAPMLGVLAFGMLMHVLT